MIRHRDSTRAGPGVRWFPSFLLAMGLALLGAVLAGAASAASDDAADYAFIQQPGAPLPLAALVRTSGGQPVRLGDLLAGRPTILALGYFHCPSLCSVVRDDLFEALAHSGLVTPDDYGLVVMSIDPAEGTSDAASARADDAARYPTAGEAAGWHFLTADAPTVAAVTQAVGFRSRYDVHLRQFLHPAGIVVLTPEGRVSGYVLGVGYNGGDLRAAVTLASSGGIAKAALPILLLCFHYDALTGRYSLAVVKVLRLGGLVTVLAIAATVLLLWRRGRGQQAIAQGERANDVSG